MDGNQPTHTVVHDQADYHWPLENWSGVCLFLCQNSLGHCRSKDSKPKSSPWELTELKSSFIRERGFSPNTQNTVALPFLVQVVLCSHSQPRIPMKELRTDLKQLWWERQPTFPTAYSSVQFFKHTVSNTAENKVTSSHAAWAPKHTRLPLKCPVPSLKGSITKMPKPEMPHTAGHTAELLWKLAFLWDLSRVPI